MFQETRYINGIIEMKMEILKLKDGADTQIRTADLILTKDALYQLSHISNTIYFGAGGENRTRSISLEG